MERASLLFAADKSGENRDIGGFWIPEGGLWDHAKIMKKHLGEGHQGQTKEKQLERGIKGASHV